MIDNSIFPHRSHTTHRRLPYHPTSGVSYLSSSLVPELHLPQRQIQINIMLRVSYWIFPILAGLIWLGMLLGLLLHCKYQTRHLTHRRIAFLLYFVCGP